MFCHQCGDEIVVQARYCPTCGTSQAEAHRAPAPAPAPARPADPVLELRPVFIPGVHFATHIPLGIFLGIWGGLFFGGFSQFAIEILSLSVPRWVPFIGFGAMFSLVLPLISFYANKKTYAKTVYTFYPHKLDYFEGFFAVEEKTIPLERVTEVNLRKGILQRKHGLGTIVLSTPATSSARAMAGIRLRDLENPDEVYAQVKEMVESSAHESHRSRLRAA